VIRIRFHGRGGHGVKTASRILGTAGFLAGYQCQDSPVYGAERRGAAVTAYTRINQEPILERGVIDHPDLIVLADETLLKDAGAGVLQGQETASAIFINTESAASLADEFGITPLLISYDVTGCTLQTLGRASALSAGLGAASAKLVGVISEDQLITAMRDEFGHLPLSADVLERNIQIARKVFAELPAVEFRPAEAAGRSPVATVEYAGPLQGTPSVLHAGNAAMRHTGSWRVERPVVDRDICTRCGLCFVECPDGAVSLDEEGYPVIDYDHCKGCMICRQVCPVVAIETKKETRSW